MSIKNNMIAIISDGSAVLGLGNIGALASIPVMEGKAALFKQFAGINAFPLCLDTQDDDEIINIVKNIAPVYSGINLEDIAAPRCFEIEKQLDKMLDIPVFHDDQHGTAIVCVAGLVNALKVVNKEINDVSIVVNGLGSAGTAIIKMLVAYGFVNFSLCDRNGLVYDGIINNGNLDDVINYVNDNKEGKGVSLKKAIISKDVFIGVSAPDLLSFEDINLMNDKPIVFAMANPNPEIGYDEVKKSKVAIYATGRSDYPNQINNVLAFPGIFKGAISVRATTINMEMKVAAINALSSIIKEDELNSEYIIPDVFDNRVVASIEDAIAQAAISSGVNQI
jgi:malate dehydrogenase (oxaloacetate-decarboxylating)